MTTQTKVTTSAAILFAATLMVTASAPALFAQPPGPPPGGERPVTPDRLRRACMPGENHTWYFRGKKFIVVADKGALPSRVITALLGPKNRTSRIVGEWELDAKKGQLVLHVLVDPMWKPKEVRLAISPAGLLRVNIERLEQYNVISFEDKLPRPTLGVTFPIYDYAQKIDLEFLQGAWIVKEHVVDGKTLDAKSIEGARITVKGYTLTLVFQGATSTGTFQLDSVPTLPTLDVKFTEGPLKGNSYRGIYELKGDTWKLCRTPEGKDRPTDLASKAGKGCTLSTAVRQK
jgi:uncharacterized protein (TIGR03067 family)